MKRAQLVNQIRSKGSLLCVGLDTDILKIPQFIVDNYDDPIFEFNKRIIDATQDLCVAYKFNIAFYEAQGPVGWQSLERSLALIPNDIFTIADAKRGDIGNTSQLYARTFFEQYNFDAITVAPYMGEDSLMPFYHYDDKWVIILGLTSNKGSQDFQMKRLESGEYLYQKVIRTTAEYGTSENTMFVVGATRTDYIKAIRDIVPDHFFLMPGIGKQGGDLEGAMKNGLNDDFGLLINSSRGIIYAGQEQNFDQEARKSAFSLKENIATFL